MRNFPRAAFGSLSLLLAATAGLVAVDISLALAQPAGQQPARPPAGRPQPAAPAQPAAAQPAAPAPEAPAQANPPTAATVSGWVTQCVSQGRKVAANCVAEQSLTVTRSGQVALIVSVRVAQEGQPARLSARLPTGLLLTAGAKLRLDTGYSVDLPIQTCDAQACFAGIQAPPELLNGMRAARQLEVQVQSANNESLSLTMSLEGFAPAHDRVK